MSNNITRTCNVSVIIQCEVITTHITVLLGSHISYVDFSSPNGMNLLLPAIFVLGQDMCVGSTAFGHNAGGLMHTFSVPSLNRLCSLNQHGKRKRPVLSLHNLCPVSEEVTDSFPSPASYFLKKSHY